jgi:hypothetical protein
MSEQEGGFFLGWESATSMDQGEEQVGRSTLGAGVSPTVHSSASFRTPRVAEQPHGGYMSGADEWEFGVEGAALDNTEQQEGPRGGDEEQDGEKWRQRVTNVSTLTSVFDAKVSVSGEGRRDTDMLLAQQKQQQQQQRQREDERWERLYGQELNFLMENSLTSPSFSAPRPSYIS